MEEKKEQDSVQQFLSKIGPRELTREEARQLHILRLKQGKPGAGRGLAEKIAGSGDAEG